MSLVTFALPSARTYEPFSRQGKAVLGKCFWGKAGRDGTAFFSVGLGSKNLPFCPDPGLNLYFLPSKAQETNEANKGVKQSNCVCGGSLSALQCIKSLWTLKDQMSGNLLVWLDHFSLETQITPVKWRKISTTWSIILNGDTQPSLIGLMMKTVNYGVDKAGVMMLTRRQPWGLATIMTMNKRFLLLRCLRWWCWQWWESDDVCAGCTAAERVPPSKWWFCRERRGPHICYDNFHHLAYYHHHSVKN